MTHDLFGKLKYKDGDEAWAGAARLPLFAAIGMRPEGAEMSPEDAEGLAAELNEQMEALRQQMIERFGDRAQEAFAAVDRAADEPETPDPKDEERRQRRAERRQKNAALLAKGKFPVRVTAPDRAEPTPAQEASFRFLLENERAVFDAVSGQLWRSYVERRWQRIPGMKPAESAADLSGHFAVARVELARQARAGFAHLVFPVDADWQDDEHGFFVVYSPDTREATWSSWDDLYDLLDGPEEPDGAGDEYVLSPHDLLLEAILTGDEPKARELVAAGADLNALGPDEYPPLWIAVDQMEVEEVRRLLAFGADPALANADEGSTPLRHARQLYRDMGFAPSKKRNELLDGVLSMMRDAGGGQMADIKNRLDAIIALLEGAEPKE